MGSRLIAGSHRSDSRPARRRTARLTRWWFGLAAVVIATTASPPTAEATRELPVSQVRVVADGSIDGPAVTEILGLEVGKPLDRRQLREAIFAFYARAEVEWLRVEAEEQEDGLSVSVRVNLRSTISRLEIRTRNPVLKKRVKKWLELRPGSRVSAAVVEASQRRVVRRLRDRGYADPQVDVFLDYFRATNSVVLNVRVEAGEPQVAPALDPHERAASRRASTRASMFAPVTTATSGRSSGARTRPERAAATPRAPAASATT